MPTGTTFRVERIPPHTVKVETNGAEVWVVTQRRGGRPTVMVQRGGIGLLTDKLDFTEDAVRQKLIAQVQRDHGVMLDPKALHALAMAAVQPPTPSEVPSVYRIVDGGFVHDKTTSGGTVATPVSNFTATIVGEIALHDGLETTREYEIEATLARTGVHRFRVLASDFGEFRWVAEKLGAHAIVYPRREHDLRVAIQLHSPDPAQRRVFTHTGWTLHEGQHIYLHAGGAIGASGPVSGIEVSLPPQLAGYRLPDPPDSAELNSDVAAVFELFHLAPDRIMFPTLGAVFRVPLGAVDFNEELVGKTGVGKSELAALGQQFYWPDMHARALPESFASTPNALEGVAFAAKNAVLTIDDFAPTGSPADVARMHRDADRLLRAQANGLGRGRMRADASLKPPKLPRGLIVLTGEDVPRGQSLRSRIFTLDVYDKDVKWRKLTTCQAAAANGVYARVMASFLKWLAPQYRDISSKTLKEQIADYRTRARTSGDHKRTPEIVASLMLGLKYFLTFAQELGALDGQRADALLRRGWTALGLAARLQRQGQADADPALRYIDLLNGVFASVRGHLAGTTDKPPTNPQVWGWHFIGEEWNPRGHCLGWIEGDDVYLEPQASYSAAQQMARESNEPLTVNPTTLHKRLHERGLLKTVEKKRQVLTIRKQIRGKRYHVLHLLRTAFEAS